MGVLPIGSPKTFLPTKYPAYTGRVARELGRDI
jgi:hypothetical protein